MTPVPGPSRLVEPTRSLPAPDARGVRAMLISTAHGAELGRQAGGLESLGCESVVQVREARDAIAMAGSLGPRLVLIDLHGPDVERLLHVARSLRCWPGLALVLVIGDLDDAQLDAARAIDPHGVMARSCRGDALSRTVAIAFARLRSETARRAAEPGGLEDGRRLAVSAARQGGAPF